MEDVYRRRLLISLAGVCVSEAIQKKKSKWVKEWLLKRGVHSHINLINELRLTEESDFRNYLRMDITTYEELLNKVKTLIEKQDTLMRKAISPHERLTATLRYLATGRSYEDLKFSTAISKQSLSLIIPETCNAIIAVLRGEYLKFPRSEADWRNISEGFETKWQFPHCLGAVDGKHVRIVPPANSGSFYFNYKKTFSVVLLGIVDSNYEFIMVDVGTNGRISDGGVIDNTVFFEKLKNNKLKIPKPECVMGTNKKLHYVFVGDDAFSLRTDFLKPFGYRNLSTEEQIFNYRLSRARRIVENVFGILANRFRIFKTDINLKMNNIDTVVMASCALHNFLRRKSPGYVAPGDIDTEHSDHYISTGCRTSDEDLADLQTRQTPRNYSVFAKQVREDFKQYFNNEGAVSWQ